jgi:hypothetical protein
MKKILSLALLIVGAGSYCGSIYITEQVLEGQSQIDQAQKKVKQADSLFSLSPYTALLGKGITGSADKKIKAGQAEVDKYTALAGELKTGGIIALVLGVITLPFAFRKKR